MKLDLILVADCANTTSDGKLNILGAFREIYAPNFPARHSSMHLVVKLVAELGEYGAKRDLTVKLLDPDGNEMINLSGPIETPKGGKGVKPEVNAILEFKDIIFNKPGPYQFVVLVDKDYKGDLAVYVNEIELPHKDQG